MRYKCNPNYALKNLLEILKIFLIYDFEIMWQRVIGVFNVTGFLRKYTFDEMMKY